MPWTPIGVTSLSFPLFERCFHTVVMNTDSGVRWSGSNLGSASFGHGCVLIGKLLDLSGLSFLIPEVRMIVLPRRVAVRGQ